MAKRLIIFILLLRMAQGNGLAQKSDAGGSQSSPAVPAGVIPAAILGRMSKQLDQFQNRLSAVSEKYLLATARREQRMRDALMGLDSSSAVTLFSNSESTYRSLVAGQSGRIEGEGPGAGPYLPYLDSMQGAFRFLQQNPDLVKGSIGKVMSASTALSNLQGKMQGAEAIKAYIRQRTQIIGRYLSTHAAAGSLMGKELAAMNKGAYYYSQQVRQYREIWTRPDQLEGKMLQLLNRVPSFQGFMRNSSLLGPLFHVPENYGTAGALNGLQTRQQVAEQVNGKIAMAGPAGGSTMQASLQSAYSQLDALKTNESNLGQGNGEMPMPDFKPNDQRTKAFWHRLEYGTNVQTTHSNYYFPTVSDLGLSVGYRLGHSNIVGVGLSYKIGWGNGIKHLALSSQGVGLRSFFEIRIKGTFAATGGLEYNYTTPFTSFQNLREIERWNPGGLIGVSKTVPIRGRVFKNTKLQLLWDMLSYQQVPKTQPFLFRIAYSWN